MKIKQKDLFINGYNTKFDLCPICHGIFDVRISDGKYDQCDMCGLVITKDSYVLHVTKHFINMNSLRWLMYKDTSLMCFYSQSIDSYIGMPLLSFSITSERLSKLLLLI